MQMVHRLRYDMKRKIICLTALFALCMVLSSCGLVKITSVNSSDLSPQPSVIPTSEIKLDRYTVIFDKDEIFPDEIYRRAAEHIDPYIEQAVKLMNSVREDRISFKVIDCDYSKRPKARDRGRWCVLIVKIPSKNKIK